jgi:hypothetical protein
MNIVKNLLGGAMLLSAAVVGVSSSQAAVITQDDFNSSFQIDAFEPLGQTFTAIENSLLSVGFRFTVMNSTFSATDPVRVDLYSGSGFGGALLASREIVLPENVTEENYVNFDFGGIATVIGQQYSAVLSIVGGSPRFGIVAQASDVYSGGTLFSPVPQLVQSGCAIDQCDASFQVTGGTAGAVPESATWAMMIGGFGMVGGAMRRRRAGAKIAFA